MLNTVEQYLKLKRRAMRSMLNGDVERYTRILCHMQALRGTSTSLN